MPAVDLNQAVHSAIERAREIPALLDAYGEFVDSPIGSIEIQYLDSVFARVLDNLQQRFPDLASKRAANTARNDISTFLSLANNSPDRVKDVLRTELAQVQRTMTASIAERFSRLNAEERRAIDATLRLVRRSTVELVFRAEVGKQLSTAGMEFERFFAAVKSESPGIRELRYENLIVEKAIFNKLLLKSKDKDYTIWVPSLYAKENVDALIEKLAVPSEHLLLSRLEQLKQEGKLHEIEPFLSQLETSLGVLPKSTQIPQELSDFAQDVGAYVVIPPLELDDISTFFEKEEEQARKLEVEEEEKTRLEEEALKKQEEEKLEQLRQRRRPFGVQLPVSEQLRRAKTEDSIYLGKLLDTEQFFGAINRRVAEKDIPNQVKTTGEYFLELQDIRSKGIAIVGSSGSGRSSTLKRLLDGVAGKDNPPTIVVIDQRGEHRGIAWKYKWNVFAFASDSQAKEFRVRLSSKTMDEESIELAADILQDWFLQSGLTCTDQQRARIASLIRSEAQSTGRVGLESVPAMLSKEADLTQLGQKLAKNLIQKSSFPRIFGLEQVKFDAGSVIFDISGRGLRDPTTKEERQIISVLILRDALEFGLKDSILVLEDLLDRFKSESLRRRAVEIITRLKQNGCSVIATSRSQVRSFVGRDSVEILHRLSGEKVINEELAEFATDFTGRNLAVAVQFFPRGYVITSKVRNPQGETTTPSACVRIEPLQFVSAQA